MLYLTLNPDGAFDNPVFCKQVDLYFRTMNRIQLSQLAVLASVASHGSFRAAARELRIAPSAVSHAISALEESLGIGLLARSTRSVAPTEAGRRLLERLIPALDEIGSALGEVTDMRVKPSGVLRLSMPRTAAYMHLLPRLKDFTRAYPEITLDLSIQDRLVDIVAEGFDAGIRLNESLERDMIAVRMGGELRILVVATPDYFAEYGKPQHPDDLAAHNCIRFRFSSGRIYRWELEKAGQSLEMAVEGSVILDDSVLIKQAILQGTGIGFVFETLIRRELDQGLLETALEDWCPSFPGLYIYYPTRNHMRPALRAFIDFYK